MVLRVKSINRDGLVHTSSCEKLVSKPESQTGLRNNFRFHCFWSCSVDLLLNTFSLFILKDKLWTFVLAPCQLRGCVCIVKGNAMFSYHASTPSQEKNLFFKKKTLEPASVHEADSCSFSYELTSCMQSAAVRHQQVFQSSTSSNEIGFSSNTSFVKSLYNVIKMNTYNLFIWPVTSVPPAVIATL